MRHLTKPGRAALRLRIGLMPLVAAAMVACGGDGGSDPAPAPTCPEAGLYACKSGETEPLYTFQWALNYLQSYFQGKADEAAFGGGIDLNVEPVHRQGIKGQGVNVLVIDTGVDLGHEDLQANADYDLSWNFLTGQNDPNPLLTPSKEAHGTNVAGIIGAAQNGKGVMGMAPLARLGGAPLIGTGVNATEENYLDAYGGAAWSRKALRDGKGIVFVKSAGNEFDSVGLSEDTSADCGVLAGAYGCVNSGNDTTNLEPNVIVTAALNAKGQAASYSSTGSVLWITGMGGEYASAGLRTGAVRLRLHERPGANRPRAGARPAVECPAASGHGPAAERGHRRAKVPRAAGAEGGRRWPRLLPGGRQRQGRPHLSRGAHRRPAHGAGAPAARRQPVAGPGGEVLRAHPDHAAALRHAGAGRGRAGADQRGLAGRYGALAGAL